MLCLVAVLLGGVFDDSSPAGTAVVAPASAGTRVDTGFAQGDTAAVIAGLQATLRTDPYDVRSLDQLALAYQQRARETGDPTYYTKSGEALHRALGLAPRDLVATSGLGSLALSRHRFAEALALGRRAHAISPTTARNYGVIGDALVELGRYPRGISRVRHDGVASAGPVVVRTDRACALPGRRPARRDRVDEARARRLRGTGRGGGLDTSSARKALLVARLARRRASASSATR